MPHSEKTRAYSFSLSIGNMNAEFKVVIYMQYFNVSQSTKIYSATVPFSQLFSLPNTEYLPNEKRQAKEACTCIQVCGHLLRALASLLALITSASLCSMCRGHSCPAPALPVQKILSLQPPSLCRCIRIYI